MTLGQTGRYNYWCSKSLRHAEVESVVRHATEEEVRGWGYVLAHGKDDAESESAGPRHFAAHRWDPTGSSLLNLIEAKVST